MSNIDVRGLAYIGKVDSVKERTYEAKDGSKKTAYKINLVIEGARLSVETNKQVLLEAGKYYILPIWFRNFTFKDKTTGKEENWQSFFLRDEIIQEVEV